MSEWMDGRRNVRLRGFSRVGEGAMASELPEVGNLESAVEHRGDDASSIYSRGI